MTVKEMHVDVRDQVQRLAANRNRKLQDDQLDWSLNSSQQVLLESAVIPVEGSGRFQIKPNKNHIVHGLVSGRNTLTAGWVNDHYISLLPSDFWRLLDDGSRVSQLCKGDTKIISYEVMHVTSVQFPFSTASSNYYQSLKLNYNNSTLIDITNLLLQRQKTFTGLPSKEMHFYIRDFLISELTRLGIRVYWEDFYNIHAPYTLLFVSTSPTVPITLQLDGIDYVGTYQDRTLEIHSSTQLSVLSPNTMTSADKGLATGITPYFKTSWISPISEQGAGIIATYADTSFIVYSTTINYVRKPRTISLSLGTDCQLSPDVHQELCNRTVEMILNRITDPAWEEVTKQNAISHQ